MSFTGDLLQQYGPDLVVAVLAGPLAAGGAAKLIAAGDGIQWPIGRGPLRAPHGPRVVGLAELGAAVLLVTLPGRLAALVAVAAYLALTVVAYTMRGQECACFGVARLAAVGRLHVGANAVAALLAGASALLAGAGAPIGWRAGVGVAAAVATLAVVRVVDARRREEPSGPPCTQQVRGVELFISDSCPSCRSLKDLLALMEPARRDAVVTTVVQRGEKLPDGMTSVPSARALDAAGSPICAPVDGIGAVKALIDTITLAVPAGRRAH